MAAVARGRDSLDDLDDVVLFDVAREAGNELIGALLAMRNRAEAAGGSAQAAVWQEERQQVEREVDDAWGRGMLLLRLRQWRARLSELGEL